MTMWLHLEILHQVAGGRLIMRVGDRSPHFLLKWLRIGYRCHHGFYIRFSPRIDKGFVQSILVCLNFWVILERPVSWCIVVVPVSKIGLLQSMKCMINMNDEFLCMRALWNQANATLSLYLYITLSVYKYALIFLWCECILKYPSVFYNTFMYLIFL